jgi:hypothetical protein
MAPQLITMLTYSDQTVKEALEVFEQCADLPAAFWGFKDVGLPPAEMRRLVERMKRRGKTVFLEVVSLGEEECLRGARLALDCGFDYLMGTVYHESVFRLMKGQATKFFPFAGKVSGHPSVLEGTAEQIGADGRRLEALGVAGFDLLAYRHPTDPEAVARVFLASVKVPVVLAGSIDGFPRLEAVKRLAPWAFTIGSAFFDRKFVPESSFRDQIVRVLEFLAA